MQKCEIFVGNSKVSSHFFCPALSLVVLNIVLCDCSSNAVQQRTVSARTKPAFTQPVFVPSISGKQKEAWRSIKVVHVQVRQSYPQMGRYSLPFISVLRRVLKHAGIRTRKRGSRGTISIIAVGKALSKIYRRYEYFDYQKARPQLSGEPVRLYTGAEVSGEIRLSAPNSSPAVTHFRGRNDPGYTVIGRPMTPDRAPFKEAFYASDSFVQRLLQTLYAVYGYPFLAKALKDREPKVRSHAFEILFKRRSEPKASALLIDIIDQGLYDVKQRVRVIKFAAANCTGNRDRVRLTLESVLRNRNRPVDLRDASARGLGVIKDGR